MIAFKNVILENDNEEIKKFASIKMPLDATLAKADVTNPEDLPIIPNNVFTITHCFPFCKFRK